MVLIIKTLQENEDNIDILPIQEAQSQVQKSKRITTKYMTKYIFKYYKSGHYTYTVFNLKLQI